MLLASTCADVPGLMERINNLERENRSLRKLVSMLTEQING